MYSTYLKKEIEVPTQDITSAGEDITIIPHAFLEDLLLNSDMTKDLNIVCHFTNIATNEAGHYVFLCSISDKEGRRAEGIGESLPATLDTEIARNYPALMAYKRAFDDAAIKYFGFSGKVYTDQQCKAEVGSERTVKESSFQAEPLDGEINEMPPEEPLCNDASTDDMSDAELLNELLNEPAPEGASEEETNVAPLDEFADEPFDDLLEEEPPEEPLEKGPVKSAPAKPKTTSTKKNTAKKEKQDSADYVAPPLEYNFDNEPEMEEETAEEDDGILPWDKQEDAEIQIDPSVTLDDEKFDVIVKYGRLNNLKPQLSIRDAYEKYPDSIRWIANEMAAYTEDQRKNKQACMEYIALMEKENK